MVVYSSLGFIAYRTTNASEWLERMIRTPDSGHLENLSAPAPVEIQWEADQDRDHAER